MLNFEEGIQNTVTDALVAAGLDYEAAQKRAKENLEAACTAAKTAYASHALQEPERRGNLASDGVLWAVVFSNLRTWAVENLMP